MPHLTRQERDEAINEIHRLAESLREDERGMEITGCGEAVAWLLVLGFLLAVGYVILRTDLLVLEVVLGIALAIGVMGVIVYLFIRVTR